MGVSPAPVAKPGLSPSCPRRRTTSPLLPLPLDSRFRGNDETRPFQRPPSGPFGKRKVTYELINSFA